MLALILSIFLGASAFAQTAQEIKKSAVKIMGISDTRVMVSDNGGFTKGQQVLVVRLKDDDDDFEIISRGVVIAIAKGKVVLDISMDDLKKLPDKTDFVVSLGNPKVFNLPKPKDSHSNDELQNVAFEKPEPGHVSFRYLSLSSKITSESPNQANSLKNIPKLSSAGFEFEWYLDFLSNYGISIGQYSGPVPIESYYRKAVDGTYSENYFKLNYRTRKQADFRFTFFFMSGSENFTTPNPDEYIVSTSTTASNLGLLIQWEPGDLLLSGPHSRFQLTSIGAQYVTAFSYQAKDGSVSRGTAGKGSLNELRFSVNFTTYLPWVPFVKRYTIGWENYSRDRSFAFSGTTESESGVSNPYVIPENQQYGERETGTMISIGIRFEDLVGKLFKPKD